VVAVLAVTGGWTCQSGLCWLAAAAALVVFLGAAVLFLPWRTLMPSFLDLFGCPAPPAPDQPRPDLLAVMRANREPAPRPGPDLFIADQAEGRDLDDIEQDAVYRARQFYGYKADLVVEHTGPVRPLHARSVSEFTALVEVRCTNFADLRKAAKS
jgi:hypothetical protein